MSKERQLLLQIQQFLACDCEDIYGFAADIEEILTQPKQEPVAWRKWDGYGFLLREYDNGGEPLFTSPPKRGGITPREGLEEFKKGYAQAERDLKRKPLSDRDINEERLQVPIGIWHFKSFEAGIKYAEKAHGITGGKE